MEEIFKQIDTMDVNDLKKLAFYTKNKLVENDYKCDIYSTKDLIDATENDDTDKVKKILDSGMYDLLNYEFFEHLVIMSDCNFVIDIMKKYDLGREKKIFDAALSMSKHKLAKLLIQNFGEDLITIASVIHFLNSLEYMYKITGYKKPPEYNFFVDKFVRMIKIGKLNIFDDIDNNILLLSLTAECFEILIFLFDFDISSLLTNEVFSLCWNIGDVNISRYFFEKLFENEKYVLILKKYINESNYIELLGRMVLTRLPEYMLLEIYEVIKNIKLSKENDFLSNVFNYDYKELSLYMAKNPNTNFYEEYLLNFISTDKLIFNAALDTILNNDYEKNKIKIREDNVTKWIEHNDKNTCNKLFDCIVQNKIVTNINYIDENGDSLLMLILKNIHIHKEGVINPSQVWIDIAIKIIPLMDDNTIIHKNKLNETTWDLANQLKIIPIIEMLIKYSY